MICEWTYYLTEGESPHDALFTSKCVTIDNFQIAESLFKISYWSNCPYCGKILIVRKLKEGE